jgi:hypothetical protein
MSSYGANLEVESQIGIPNSFDLVIDTEHSNHHCRVVWRKARRSVSRSNRRSVVNGNILNSEGIRVGVVLGPNIFDLTGKKLYTHPANWSGI